MGDKIDWPPLPPKRIKTDAGQRKKSSGGPENQGLKTGDDGAPQALKSQVKKTRPVQRISAKALQARAAGLWDRMNNDTEPVCDLIFSPKGKDKLTVHVQGAITPTLGSPLPTCVLEIKSADGSELTHAMAAESAHQAIATLHPGLEFADRMRVQQSIEKQLKGLFPVIEQSIHEMLPGVVDRAKAATKELGDMIRLIRERLPDLPTIAQPEPNLENPHAVEVRFQLPDPRNKR